MPPSHVPCITTLAYPHTSVHLIRHTTAMQVEGINDAKIPPPLLEWDIPEGTAVDNPMLTLDLEECDPAVHVLHALLLTRNPP